MSDAQLTKYPSRMKLRVPKWEVLMTETRWQRMLRRFEWPMALLALLIIPVLVMEERATTPEMRVVVHGHQLGHLDRVCRGVRGRVGSRSHLGISEKSLVRFGVDSRHASLRGARCDA